MRRIKYIKSDKFFAKEYKDGIIVAFKNVGDNNSSYADQIHQMVSKNFGVDLFVSDIIESISVTNSHKDSIKDSLFIYVKNGISISACRISSCPNKDYIDVKYDSEKVLTVQKKRSKRLWCVCILVLLCICGYNTIFDDDINTDEPEVEIQKVGADEHLRIADRAFVAYVESLDESEGIIALTNYRKALSLAKKNGLFSKSQREKIEQCINVLEKELELY